jgi:Ankyrin repeats (3 copies)
MNVLLICLFICMPLLGMKLPDSGTLVPFAGTEIPFGSVKNIVHYAVQDIVYDIPGTTGLFDNDEHCSATMTKRLQAGELQTVSVLWKQIIREVAPLLQFKQKASDELFCHAVENNWPLTVKVLLERGANINVIIRKKTKEGEIAFLDGSTPLFFAAYNGNADMVKQLLNSGARTDIVTAAGISVRELVKSLLTNNHDTQVHATYQPIYDLLGAYNAIVSVSSSSSVEDEPELG